MQINKASKIFLDGYFLINERREKTKSAYISDMAQFQIFAGTEFNILSLKNTHIEDWVAHLKSKEYSPASIRRKLAVLKTFCSYWVRQGVFAESPFWRVKVNFGKIVQLPRTLTENEIRCLLTQSHENYLKLKNNLSNIKKARHRLTPHSSDNYLSLRNIALLELLFATGMRVGEVSAIDAEDIMPAEASFKINGKGGKERLAFVVDKVTVEIQQAHLNARTQIKSDSSALFLNARGNRLSTQGIAGIIRQLCEDIGITRHITPHMLRHTVATLLLRNGVDIRLVQEFLGHSSIVTTQRYTHVAKEHMIRELRHRHPSLTFRTSTIKKKSKQEKIHTNL